MTTRPELQEREIGELWGRYNFRSREAYLSQKANLILVVAFSSLEPSENHVGMIKGTIREAARTTAAAMRKLKKSTTMMFSRGAKWAHCSL